MYLATTTTLAVESGAHGFTAAPGLPITVAQPTSGIREAVSALATPCSRPVKTSTPEGQRAARVTPLLHRQLHLPQGSPRLCNRLAPVRVSHLAHEQVS